MLPGKIVRGQFIFGRRNSFHGNTPCIYYEVNGKQHIEENRGADKGFPDFFKRDEQNHQQQNE